MTAKNQKKLPQRKTYRVVFHRDGKIEGHIDVPRDKFVETAKISVAVPTFYGYRGVTYCFEPTQPEDALRIGRIRAFDAGFVAGELERIGQC